MNARQLIAVFLAVVLIATFVGAVTRAIPWMVFWLFAGALFIYTRLIAN